MEKNTKKKMAELTGLPVRSIQFHTEQGIVTPDVANPKGKGKNRIYSEENVIEFKILKLLKEAGLKLTLIKMILNNITYCRKRGQSWWKDRIDGEESKEVVYCIIYDPFSTDTAKIHFMTDMVPGHKFDEKNNQMDLRYYMGHELGHTMVIVFDITRMLDQVLKEFLV